MSSGELLASVKARGIGVKPALFLNDGRRVVSSQEKCVLVRGLKVIRSDLFILFFYLFSSAMGWKHWRRTDSV